MILYEVDSMVKKNNKDMIVVDIEKEIGNRMKFEDCEVEFRLFFSELSDFEDNLMKKVNLSLKWNDVIEC